MTEYRPMFNGSHIYVYINKSCIKLGFDRGIRWILNQCIEI